MSNVFDLVVIGAGPGGYIAAIRAAQLGLKVACVDAWRNAAGKPAPGGTCTNVGCIPSKALLQSSHLLEQAKHDFGDHGITVSEPTIDLARMLGRKDTVVRQNNDGILYLFKKNKVTFFHAQASFKGKSPHGWELSLSAEPGSIHAAKVIVATGSVPRALPNVAFDEDRILSNQGALQLTKVPGKLGVIGAGVIGLELGSVWRRLGAEVTVLEALPTFLGMADEHLAKEAYKILTKQGLHIHLGVQILEIKSNSKGVQVRYRESTAKEGDERVLEVDRLIVSIGRVPNTQGLGAEAVGLALDARGAIEVDAHCATNLPGVWAVGDVVRGPMLAHKAEEEGVAVAERIAGRAGHVDLDLVPSVVYTHPEMAWVGKTEAQLKESGRAYRAGTVPFAANGRARAAGETSGFVKILADAVTDEILGVHILGAQASELIAEASVAMAFRASSEDIARICHAHPTLAEAMKEAALAVDLRTLNL